MPTIFVAGDLLASKLPAIAHGCNCVGAMGAGIAKPIRELYPDMYEKYNRMCANGTFKLGRIFTHHGKDRVVFNLATQPDLNGADMDAVKSSLLFMVNAVNILKLDHVGIPKIGAGLGGLEWEPIKQHLIEMGNRTSATLVVFEDYVAGKAWDAPVKPKPVEEPKPNKKRKSKPKEVAKKTCRCGRFEKIEDCIACMNN